MAKGSNIGFLNFGIDGDNKELLKKLQEAESKAVSIAKILQNIKLNTGGNALASDVQKAQLAADKLAVSQNRVAMSAQNTIKAEQQAALAIENTSNAKKKSLVLDQQKAKEEARTASEVQKLADRRINQLAKEAQDKRKALLDEERLAATRNRNASNEIRNQRALEQATNSTSRSLFSQQRLLREMSTIAIGAFSVHQLVNFGKEVINVRGEIQQLEFAFETMLGSKSASTKMMQDIINLSLETPYTLTDMAGNVKQLIAMGIETEKVIDTMKALGDVAAGVSVPIWRIAINYGQVAALGRLQAREIRDFAMAGVPIVDELAKMLGKTTGEITDLVSAGKIGFPEVEEAFKRMSSEGGKFNNMMQKQNSSVLGQIGKLKEQIQLMLNEIGESSEGIIYGALNVTSELVHNYEKVGKVLVGLVATYGAYKTAVAIASQAEAGWNVIQLLHYNRLLLVEKAQKLLNRTMLSNPYVLATVALVSLAAAMWALHDSTTAIEKTTTKVNEAFAAGEASALAERKELARLKVELESATKGTEKYDEIKDQIISKYGQYYKGLANEINQVGLLASTYDQLTESIRNSALARMKDSELKRIEGEYQSGISTALNNVKSYIDGTTGNPEDKAKIYKAVFDAVAKGNDSIIDSQTINRLNGLRKKDTEQFRKEYNELTPLNKKLFEHKELYRKVVEAKRANQDLDDARKIIDDKFPQSLEKENEAVKASANDMKSYGEKYNDALKAYNHAKKVFDNIKSNKNLYSTEAYTAAKEELELAKKAFDDIGGETKDKKSGNDKKDSVVEKLKKEIDLIKSAQTEYEKLNKIVGEDAAFDKIRQIEPFKNLTKEQLSSDGLLDLIGKQISSMPSNPNKEQQDYLISLFTLRNDTVAKVAKENVTLIEKELEKYKESYSLYETLFKVTGNKEQSEKLAFGEALGGLKTYREKLQEEFDKTTDLDLKEKLGKQLSDIDFTNRADFSKRMADLVKEYQSVEEKITVIKSQGEAARLEILKNADGADQALIDQRLKYNQEAINKDIAALTDGILQSTESYQRLFGDISEMSERELNYLINKWKEALDAARRNADGTFSLSIDGKEFSTTEKEISSFTKKVLASEKELRSKNPFKTLLESIKELQNSSLLKDKLSEELSLLKNERDNADTPEDIEKLNTKIKETEDLLSDLDAKNATTWSKMSANIGKANAYVQEFGGSVKSMFEAFGASEEASNTLTDLMELMQGAADTAEGIARMKAGDISGLPQTIKGVAQMVSSIDSLFSGDKGIKEYEKAVDMYKRMEEVISQVIDRQKELLNISVGSQSVSNLKNSIDAIKKQIEYQKKVLDKFMDSGAGASSHSKGYRENRYIKKWQEELQKNGLDIKSWEDLYKLSVDEIYDLQSKMPDFYADLFDETKNYLELIIEKEKELIELKKIEKETLTGMSFDSLLNSLDGFIQATDMTFAQIGNSFEDMMRNAVLNFVKKKYLREALTEWYEQFADAYRDDKLNEEEVAELRGKFLEIAKKSQEMYDSALDAADLNKNNTAKNTLSKGIQEITEDTANLLASYLNAVRADVSATRILINQLILLAQINSNTIGAQLAELMKIQVNTLNTANNTARLVQLAENTNSILQRGTTKGSGTAFNM